ncbi:MAG: hypothetical protein LBB98_03075 [Treponema sp.]|jgi:hypothetical protein|nr:hypothetical protein [Treponema sp.]
MEAGQDYREVVLTEALEIHFNKGFPKTEVLGKPHKEEFNREPNKRKNTAAKSS